MTGDGPVPAGDGPPHPVLAHPYGVVLSHRFQAAHRLPHLPGQCENLHGHSWRASVTVTAPALTRDRIVVEFGAFKKALFKGWVDTFLDHGSMLAGSDPLAPVLLAEGSKVFRFGLADADGEEKLATELAYPTVEDVAHLVSRVAVRVLATVPHAPGARVGLVEIEETDVNRAWFVPDRDAAVSPT